MLHKKCILTLLLCLLLTACTYEEANLPAATPTPTVVPVMTPTPTPAIAPTPTPLPEPVDDATPVRVRDYIPNIAVDLRYATERNFTGQVIYDFTEPYLRWGTVKKLMAVQQDLNNMGYGLLIWDGYRPPAAQFKLWEIVPDANFVANPYNGYSSHSRGNTVDVTLVTLSGDAVEMPSDFDEFAAIADRDYSDVSEAAAANARLLEMTMEAHGFTGYVNEWWHYSDTVRYEAEDLGIA